MSDYNADITQDDNDRLSEQVLESLIEGGFICEVTSPDQYRMLTNPDSASSVSRFLSHIGRRLRQTEDGKAFYAVLLHLKSTDRKAAVKRQLNLTINTLEPMVRWLELVMSATQKSSTLSAGDILRVSELQTIIESTPALSDELDRITKIGIFKTTRDTDGDRLGAVISKLVDEGYLEPSGGRSSLYVGTGKWSYLYEVIDFIVEHEQLPESGANADDEQRELQL